MAGKYKRRGLTSKPAVEDITSKDCSLSFEDRQNSHTGENGFSHECNPSHCSHCWLGLFMWVTSTITSCSQGVQLTVHASAPSAPHNGPPHSPCCRVHCYVELRTSRMITLKDQPSQQTAYHFNATFHPSRASSHVQYRKNWQLI